jgi:hypothetical protein
MRHRHHRCAACTPRECARASLYEEARSGACRVCTGTCARSGVRCIGGRTLGALCRGSLWGDVLLAPLSTVAYSTVLNSVPHRLRQALYGRVRRSTAHLPGCEGHTTGYGALWYSKGALGWLVLLQTLVEGGALVRALGAHRILLDRHSALAPDVVQRRHAFRLPTSATPTRPRACRGRWRRMPPTRRVRAIGVRCTSSDRLAACVACCVCAWNLVAYGFVLFGSHRRLAPAHLRGTE